MPHMDGEGALEEIRRMEPTVPVIVISGYTESEARERFAGNGSAGFVQKPFSVQQLVGKVREVLAG